MAKEITRVSDDSSPDSNEPSQADLVAQASITAEDDGLETVEVPPEPAHFEDWNLAPTLMRALGDMGYDRPMPVQEAVFATLTEGDDLMVQSKTGSGKTAAFGIPIAQMLSGGKKGVQSLILAPTRELALQVAKEIQKLVIHMDVAVVPIYGGAPIGPQIKKLEDGGQIVAGTPGRVLDHIRRGTMDTSGIRMLVLDECDEMLSMGFQEEIENIVSTLPAKDKRQTMLFSATIPKEIERIGRRHMREPKMLTLSSDSVGAELIDHYYYVVSGMARNRDLLKLMKAEKPESAIIFCNTRDETNTVARYLRKNGYDSEALSSDLSQADRERVMGRMRDKNLNFLVATDIAARGIDISELSHVINYTFPPSPEVYVHRSGRTGRAGKEGTALSLVGPREIGAFYYLKLIYKIIPTERDLPNADEMAAIEEGELYERVIAMLEGDARKEHVALARRLWQSNEGERVVALLLQQLLTKPAKAAVAKTPAVAAVAAPVVAAAPAVAAAESNGAEEERPRRKRRRRGREEEASSASAPEAAPTSRAAMPETSEASTTEEAPPAVAVVEAPANEQSAASDEETSEERPRRKRRRRRSQGDEAEVTTSAPQPDLPGTEDGDSEPKAEAKAASEEKVADAEAETEISASAAEAKAAPAAEEASEDEAVDSAEASETERPRRKRRRRGRGAGGEETETTAAESSTAEAPTTKVAKASDEDDVGDTQEVKRRFPEREEKPARKPVKTRERKPRTDAGAHVEFWEAWADSKDQPADNSAEVSPAKSSSDEEEDEKPARKRRRRRRGSKDSEASEEESLASSDESPADEESEETKPKAKAKAKAKPRAKTKAAKVEAETETEAEAQAGNEEEEQADVSVRLFVNVGKREDADVEAIRSFLGEALGDTAEQLGRITLRNTHCYIRVPEDFADEIIDTCTGLVFHEREMVVERARAKR
tara:strand:+ start:22367 stop:25192 length:2826 start_codon:yes stop_codon:yes gene_type:complete